MSKAMIVGIAGRSGVGKDTTAEILKPLLGGMGRPVAIRRFAGALKGFLALCTGQKYNYNDRSVYDQIVPGFDITVRQWLEGVGQHMCAWDQQFWVKTLMSHYDNTQIWLIPDVRKDFEAKAIRDMGGVVIHIQRPEAELGVELKPSENSINSIIADYVIVNDSTTGHLASKVRVRAIDIITHFTSNDQG